MVNKSGQHIWYQNLVSANIKNCSSVYMWHTVWLYLLGLKPESFKPVTFVLKEVRVPCVYNCLTYKIRAIRHVIYLNNFQKIKSWLLFRETFIPCKKSTDISYQPKQWIPEDGQLKFHVHNNVNENQNENNSLNTYIAVFFFFF